MLIIRWLGQACFLLSTLTGTHVLIDPPNPQVGYHIAAHSIPAGIVFVSHKHPDHDYVEASSGAVSIVEPLPVFEGSLAQAGKAVETAASSPISRGLQASNSLHYERIFAYHDNAGGKQRGPDTITVFQEGGLRVCHLGDLGQLSLTPAQVKGIGRVDVLMVPIGGFFTIDGPQAAAIVSQIHPRVILPMHYQTAALNPDLRAKLAPPAAFLAAMRGKADVVHVSARDLILSPRTLPRMPTIYLLRYE